MAWLTDALRFTSIRRERRRAPRRITFIDAKLQRGSGWRDVRICNISPWGLMLQAAEPPELGELVEVRHRGWSAVGKVVWRVRSRVGIQASAPIEDSKLFERSEMLPHVMGDIRPAKKSNLLGRN